MSSTPRPTVTRSTEGRTITIVGDIYRFLAVGDETGGRYATWEAIVLPEGGPPPHIHTREEESFYILEGQITFVAGDERIVAGPGTFLNVSPGILHSFKNETGQPAKMLISVAPAGLERMFFEVGQPALTGTTTALPPTEQEIEKLLSVAPRYGIEIKLPAH